MEPLTGWHGRIRANFSRGVGRAKPSSLEKLFRQHQEKAAHLTLTKVSFKFALLDLPCQILLLKTRISESHRLTATCKFEGKKGQKDQESVISAAWGNGLFDPKANENISIQASDTRQLRYRKEDRAMRPINGCPEKFPESSLRTRLLFPKFVLGFCSHRY